LPKRHKRAVARQPNAYDNGECENPEDCKGHHICLLAWTHIVKFPVARTIVKPKKEGCASFGSAIILAVLPWLSDVEIVVRESSSARKIVQIRRPKT
jgi:hypothetical protein